MGDLPVTARLIVMMEPEDKKKLVASARAQKVSVAKLARQRLVAPLNADEQIFLDAVVDLGEKARHVFAEVDAREAREAAARAAQPVRETAIKAGVEAAFEAARAHHEQITVVAPRGTARPRKWVSSRTRGKRCKRLPR